MEKRYFQPEIETASAEQIKAWQDERLAKQVKHVWDNVPYYRKKMEEAGLTPDDIKGRDDLHKLPFITKADAMHILTVLWVNPLRIASESSQHQAQREKGLLPFTHSMI